MNSFGPLLSALLGALLLLTAVRGQVPKEFEAGKEYFYNYIGYSLSGRPDSGKFSGFKLNASLCLSAVKSIKGGFHMQVHFTRARLDLVNGDVCPFRPGRGDSPSKLLTNSDAFKEIKTDLTKGVFHFNWRSGSISGVRKPPSEEEDLSNLKKGAIGMFNFDLSRMKGKDPTMMIDWKYEEGLEGVCKTGYVAIDKGNDKMTLERIRNLYDCQNSSAKVHRFLQGMICSEDGSLSNTALRADSRTTLELTKKSATKFFVRSATTLSQYILPNPNEPQLMVGSYIAQELTFDKVGKKPKAITDKLDATTISAVVKMRAKKDEDTALRKEIDSYLTTMNKTENDVKFNAAVRDLVSALRRASEKDLNYALEKAKSSGDRIMNAVYDVFGNVGTKQAQKIILDKMDDKTTSDARAACMLRSLAFSSFDPSGLEETLMKKANSKRLQEEDRVKTLQTLWMMVGALHCRLERRNDPQMAKFLKEQFEAKHPKMDDDSKMTTLLMALGNAGAEPSLDYMLSMAKKMKKKKTLTLHVRLHGVHALRKYAQRPKLQSKVRMILWKTFANYLEDSELRINAFQILMKTNPSRRHMAILMNQLRREPCRHVRSYVVSYLQMIAKSGGMSPCRTKLTKLVRWALPTLPGNNRWNPGMFESRIIFYPVMKSMGIFVSIIYCSHSPLPRSVTIGELFANAQTEINIWSMTMRSEESGVLLRNIASPGGSILDRVKTLFKEFKGKAGKAKGAQSTVHYSLSGEDAGYFGTNFLGSKSNPIDALQMMLKVGRKGATKTVYMDGGAHLPTSFGTTLNWWGGASSMQQMNFQMKKEKQMTFNFGFTSLAETGLGFSYGASCGHAMMRYYFVLHPGKPHDVTMTMSNSKNNKKMSFAVHVMPHKNEMEAMRMGVQYYQVIRDGSGSVKYFPMSEISEKRQTKQDMGPFRVTSSGITKNGFNRMTRNGEMDMRGMIKQLSKPFEMTVKRMSKFCGMKMDMELVKAPTEAAPPVTTRIGARKYNLKKGLKSGKIRGSPARPYMRPLGLQVFARAEAKVSVIFYKMKKKRRSAVNFGVASVKVGPSGDTMEINVRPRMGKPIKLQYRRQVVGALPYYDINNPFKITINAGSKGTLKITQGTKTLAKITRESKMSKYWIKEWVKLLKNPATVASTWPDVYHCYTDIQNGFYGSPCCYRAWRQLQTFDTVSAEAVDPGFNVFPMIQETIGSRVARLYSFVKREQIKKPDGTVLNRMSASFCPSDVRAVDNNRNYYARVLDGFPRRTTCVVTFFQKQRKLYVRTFDGLNYAGGLPGKTTKGKGFVLARDCKRGSFSAGIGSFKSGTRYVVVYSKVGGKSCKAIAYQKPKRVPRFIVKGSGCKGVKSGKSGRIYYADFKPIGVKIMITGKTEVSLQVNRMIYLNSLHGICGNFDREPEYLELLGCKNGAVTYFSNDKSGWDAMIKNYMTKSISKFKDCA